MTRQTSANQGVNVQPVKVDAFGERISLAIGRAGGAKKMAEKTGMSTSVLRSWRAEKSDPSRTSLVKVARAAGVSVEWLATGEGDPDQGAGAHPQQAAGPQEMDLVLLEEVARAAIQELKDRGIVLEPADQARAIRVLYRHFDSRSEQPDHDTISNIIDLAAYR